ncbi:MAG: tyrosine-type recombinase/integrase [Xanthobacteraceae bacterium]
MKLTSQEIARYQPPADKADHIVFDDDLAGFGLRYRGGKRVWVYQYAFGSGAERVNGRLTLGEYPALPPAKARSTAEDLYAKVRLGQHPAADKKTNRSEAKFNFGHLVARYLQQRHNELRANSYTEAERYLDRYARPLHGLPVKAIDRRRIADLLDTVAIERGNVTSNRCHASLSALFSWGIKRGLCEANPVIGTEVRREDSRDRVLTDKELATIWNTVVGDDYADIIRLLMLTGCRAREISELRWSEIDYDRGVISLPPERTKNARPHEIPISQTIRDILAARNNGRDFVFGRGVGFKGWGKCKVRLDKAIEKKLGKALPGWVTHDLRRTFATRLADLGIQPHIIEAALNHISGHKGGVAGIYNRSAYKVEKESALALWDKHIAELVS